MTQIQEFEKSLSGGPAAVSSTNASRPFAASSTFFTATPPSCR
jgi:hypothetical protein